MALTLDTLAEKAEMDKTGDTLSQLCIDAAYELQRACKKFPKFPDTLMEGKIELVRMSLSAARMRNDAVGGYEATAASVIGEELCEFYEAVLLGDAHAARRELVQCIAMLLRAYVHLPHYCRPVKPITYNP